MFADMDEMNVNEVFEKLFERMQDHEKHVDARFGTVETAMNTLKRDMQRRIDRLDEA